MSEELIGTRKGDYEILGVLGAGGMGKVYKVRNVLSDRIEAMKVLLPNLTDQKDLVERFLREIKVLAGLSHPNIAGLRTALTIDNQLIMIMEYVEGTTLGSRVERGPIRKGDREAGIVGARRPDDVLANLQIDDAVLAERGNGRAGLRIEGNHAVSGRHIDDSFLPAVAPVSQAAAG